MANENKPLDSDNRKLPSQEVWTGWSRILWTVMKDISTLEMGTV